jgi:excisionase family DNA binding protein
MEQSNSAQRLLTLEEVTSQLRVHPNTVMKMLKEGQIPGVKVGNRWRILPDYQDALTKTTPG